MRRLMMFALACVLATQSSAQQTPSPEGVIRINVNLVQVDAVVTDAKGKPVTNLTADDFEVLQDGKTQTITNFSFVDVRDSRVNTPSPPAVPRAQQAKNQPAPVPPPPLPPLRSDQIRRTIALMVDDLALSADGTIRVRQSLKKWVDTEMRPGDLVAVMRTSAGMGSLQQFSADKRVLYAAIDLVQYHPGRVGVASFAPVDGARLQTQIVNTLEVSTEVDRTLFNNEIDQTYMLGSIGAIQYVVQGLRDLPGRKSMILFSENMQFTYLEGPGLVNTPFTSPGLVEDRLNKLIDAANRSSVVIYAIDPRGVVFTGLTAEDSTNAPGGDGGGLTPLQISRIDSSRTRDLIASQDGMILLTEKTGGLFLHNNDIHEELRQMVDDGDGYYLLGYQPAASTFDEKTRHTFHSIKVRLKKPGLRVRSRTGFFGTPDGDVSPAPVGRQAQIARAITAPFTTGALRVQLTTLFSESEKEGAYINAMLHFDAHDLTFTEEPGGVRKALFDTFVVTFDVDGRPVDAGDKTWTLRVEDNKYDELLKRGLVYSMHLPVKKPGAYQMRIVLRDAPSEQVGSATQFIEVPDLKKGRLALSGIVLAAEQSRPAGAGDPAEGAIAAQDPNGTAAVRIFKAGTPMVYVYQILNAHPGSDKKFDLNVQTRLFREGQQVYAGTSSALNVDGQKDPKHLIGAGRLELAQATPGHYALQVIVTDKLAKEKYRIAAQSMDFEIQ